jgi:hypothetical protein
MDWLCNEECTAREEIDILLLKKLMIKTNELRENKAFLDYDAM